MAGWFDEQIKKRIRYDREGFQNSFAELSSIVSGNVVLQDAPGSDRNVIRTAIEEILKYYQIKPVELPEEIEELDDQLEYLLQPTGMMRRVVRLEGRWWSNAYGPMLGKTTSGEVVALIPAGLKGYTFFDRQSRKTIKLSKRTNQLLSEEAISFYRPLPLRELDLKDLIKYIIATLTYADLLLVALAALAVSLLGLFTPYATKLLFDQVVPSGNAGLLLPMTVLLVGVSMSSLLIGIVRSLLLMRIETKMNIPLQAAAMSRLLTLPAIFFKQYNAGELSSRLDAVNQLSQMISGAVLSTGMTALFSIVYIFQMLSFAPSLARPALLILFVQSLAIILVSLLQVKLNRRRMKLGAKLNGLTFSSLAGIQKIKLTGAERRVFSKWADLYKQVAEIIYNPPLLIKLQPVLAGLIAMAGTIVIYYGAARSAVEVADYMAFNASYGLVSGAIMALAGVAAIFANIKPLTEMVEPILKAVPEAGGNKRIITELLGNIEINSLSFRYKDDMPLVINDLSLKIRSGQYLAIVGKTGCGKSTLMRLMLGFETPQRGAIYYDGQDLSRLDLRSLRKNIGSVMQDGRLFSGDIYSNIMVTAPWLSLEDAWQAAEMAGIADDIRAMPMGMQTMISEGSGGISGGQRQRLLIARAVVAKPNILIFDEATSALDNITQKQVSEALDSLKCTRIIIAHRLSTIRHCDRIVVLNEGCLVEDGSYDQLLIKGGYFAELVQRQRLDLNP
jgi:NHLM bacteriocin system ABC transporter ATP-binding protein